MKNMNNKYLNIFGVLLVAFTFHACINDLDVTPINPQVTQTFNQDQVFAKVYAAYALTGQEGPAGNNDIDIVDEGRFSLFRCLWNCNELSTDEAACAWGDAEVIDLNQNTWTAGNFSTEALYARLYFIVSISNHFLEETAKITDEKTLKQRAEVKFLRALAYYYLMDNFGNVPFTTIVGTKAPHQIERANLFAWIRGELKAIENDMYEPLEAPYYRVDKAANWLLQARLYLNSEVYTGTAKWDSAAIYAKKVIDSRYQLAPTYRHLFMGDNAGTLDGSSVNSAPQEIIFPLAADGIKTQSWGLSLFLIGSTYTSDMGDWGTNQGWAGNRARQDLIKKFFPNPPSVSARDTNMTMVTYPSNVKDDRALFFRKNRTLSIVNLGKFKEGYSVIKFSNRRADGGTPHDPLYVDMDVPFMRLAEAYLTYAEAVLRGAPEIEGYSALAAVNALRTRAHSNKIAASISLSADENFNTGSFNIINEWAREFFFEGRRRIDLIRFGMFGGDTTYKWEWKGGEQAGKNFSADFNLFPIPTSDLNANSNLIQNPGY